MSYEILTKSYGRRLPKITATATSTDDLATLGTDYAEGSTCVISDTTYKLDKVQGWVDPSSGGGGGGGGPSIYDENDLILRMDYYWDDDEGKFNCFFTPSLDDVRNLITSDAPIGAKRLVATYWDSAEKRYIEDRVICDNVRFTIVQDEMYNDNIHFSAGYSSPIFPGDAGGWFDSYGFQYIEETGSLTTTYGEYSVSITVDN